VGQEPSGNVRAERRLKRDRRKAELIEVLNRFCSAFARRDPGPVLRLCAADLDLVVVTSEESVLRGPAELRRFLDRYVEGSTTNSWEWDRHDVSIAGHDVSIAGSVAWLSPTGPKPPRARSASHITRTRMTPVLERLEDHWLVRQVHGSSPH
jgi:SnoaL-like domain